MTLGFFLKHSTIPTKEIIQPIWEHYGYERIWKPAEGIVGNHYYLPSLTTDCSAMETLLDKINKLKK